MTAPDVRTPGGNRANAGLDQDAIQHCAPIGQAIGNSPTDPEPAESPYSADKAFANMAAQAALAGCALYRLADGELLVSRWGLSKSCPDLRSVAALLNRIGGRP